MYLPRMKYLRCRASPRSGIENCAPVFERRGSSLDLVFICRHLFPGTAIKYLDRSGTQSESNPGGIDSRIAAADYHDSRTDLDFMAEVYLTKEPGSGDNATALFTRDVQTEAIMSSGSDENRYEITA
jgi:hypothetical protein